jgi:hypothetical protein
MRKLLALGLVTGGLLLPASASAGYWVYNGWIGPGTHGGCPAYQDRSVCSGFNTWYQAYAYVTGTRFVEEHGTPRIHCGFYAGDVLRGRWLDVTSPTNTQCSVYANEVGWGGWYLRVAHTWFAGGDTYGWYEAYA